ncbi:hypothetical protein TIFTF001_041501 [Ficus carica]|uniref:Aminotransferase class V domain-containing protein n=1 Tax=Ficus carica TaxID=3494 RepID=A0AA87ZXF1_FICCA|nr:hypothetical protein TIFTF001_041501 [Ficus carica]
MVHEASDYIKKCLGRGPDDALLFCGSGTTSAIKRLQEVMGIAVPSILRERVMKTLSNEEKWIVFVGPFEHHSNLLSWRQSLAEVVEIGLDENGLLDMEALRLKLECYKYAQRPILGLGSTPTLEQLLNFSTNTEVSPASTLQHSMFSNITTRYHWY